MAWANIRNKIGTIANHFMYSKTVICILALFIIIQKKFGKNKKMMKNKTLKDIFESYNLQSELWDTVLRQEAIKWIKEDMEDFGWLNSVPFIQRWMKRFNITNEDLK